MLIYVLRNFYVKKIHGGVYSSLTPSVKSMFVLKLSACCVRLISPLSICFTNHRDLYIAGSDTSSVNALQECIVHVMQFVALPSFLLIPVTWGDTVAVRNEIALRYSIIQNLLRSSKLRLPISQGRAEY